MRDRRRYTRGRRDVARDLRPLEVIDLCNRRDSVTSAVKGKGSRESRMTKPLGISVEKQLDRFPDCLFSNFQISVCASVDYFT